MSSSKLWSKSNLDTSYGNSAARREHLQVHEKSPRVSYLGSSNAALHDAKRALTESGQQAVAKYGDCFAVVMTK
jgi:hypothetical protein